MFKSIAKTIIISLFVVIPFSTMLGSYVVAREILSRNETEYNSKALRKTSTGIRNSNLEDPDKFGILNTKQNLEKQQSQNFTLVIPKIDLNKEVTPEVDPRDKAIYVPILERNLAHGKYTLYPDQVAEQQSGVTYIFGHREGEAGYLNRLGELVIGDQISVEFNGLTYEYRVTNIWVVSASDSIVYSSKSSTPLLRIQTCENGVDGSTGSPGAPTHRLMVDAEMLKIVL